MWWKCHDGSASIDQGSHFHTEPLHGSLDAARGVYLLVLTSTWRGFRRKERMRQLSTPSYKNKNPPIRYPHIG